MTQQNGKIDFERIANTALLSSTDLLFEWFPAGVLDGHEFKIGDVTGSKGSSLSINVKTGKWSDFASGLKGGDLISLYAAIQTKGSPTGKDQTKAAVAIAKRFNLNIEEKKWNQSGQSKAGKKKDDPRPTEWLALPFVDPDAPSPPDSHYKLGKASKIWSYHDIQGRLVGRIARFDPPEEKERPLDEEPELGKKQILPQSWCKSEESPNASWRWKAFASPRPLYNLKSLKLFPGASVYLPEGEKTADAAQRIFPDHPVLTWSGGSNAYALTDFSPLRGRHIRILPDNDVPGTKAAEAIGTILVGLGCTVQICRIEESDKLEEGWDVADVEGKWDVDAIQRWVKIRLKDWIPPVQEIPVQENPEDYYGEEPPHLDGPPLDDYDHGDGQTEINISKNGESQANQAIPNPVFAFDEEMPFRVLGYNGNVYYYYPRGTMQILELSSSAHTKNNLIMMAPLDFWARRFPQRSGVNWDAAMNALMRMAEARGVFVARDLIRGRGAWMDKDQIVLNLGNQLIINRESVSLAAFRSKNFYEAGQEIPFNCLAAPLDTNHSRRLLEICKKLHWEKPISAYCLAGWIMIALVSGVLPWRSHVWVYGESGCGKTTVMKKIVHRILNNFCISVYGRTTEAAVRHSIKTDAIPVIFDESERSGDKYTDSLIQGIIELARISSSGGYIYKGTQNQSGAKAFVVRSCFAFASVVDGANTFQDESRITLLKLVKPEDCTAKDKERNKQHYNELMQMVSDYLTDEFIDGLRVRVINNVHVLLKNIETFTNAVALHLGSRRTADQLGPLLAGAYLAYKDEEITPAAALEWIKERDWLDHTTDELSKNENILLNKLMYHKINIQHDGKNFGHMTVSELIAIALERKLAGFSQDVAEEHLQRYGFRTDSPYKAGATCNGQIVDANDWRDGVLISHNSPAIRDILRGTAWEKKWHPMLLTLKTVREVDKTLRINGRPTRAVWVPLDLCWNGKDDLNQVRINDDEIVI
ncbi:MAG: hypothetical protein HQL75_00455 [Magnetococcales bacterium]|nr:hypothetical protein [Magnetococcales bacterium]